MTTPIKRFNTVGPCLPANHYMLPIRPRLSEIDKLIDGNFYFSFQAPPKSGKTTLLEALTGQINAQGQRYALLCSLMSLRGINHRRYESMSTVVEQINEGMLTSQVDLIRQKADLYNTRPGMDDPSRKVKRILNYLCEDLDKELVVFFDEADSLTGLPLITFLSQIRDGYNLRHLPGNRFPSSIALVGLHHVRDYTNNNYPHEERAHQVSPFYVNKRSLTLANFTESEIKELYQQHTEASAQVFEPSAVTRAWSWSEGQPRLVNALADQVISEDLNNNYSVNITAGHIDQAAENLLLRQETHLDSLFERLKEPRVRRVMEPVLIGAPRWSDRVLDDDIQY
ncbi:MAG: ATP-binding protein, partial [Deltaproteobacteria bacterium]|nr:ATP-binding protein [Deltaproteobacteria bacterium]